MAPTWEPSTRRASLRRAMWEASRQVDDRLGCHVPAAASEPAPIPACPLRAGAAAAMRATAGGAALALACSPGDPRQDRCSAQRSALRCLSGVQWRRRGANECGTFHPGVLGAPCGRRLPARGGLTSRIATGVSFQSAAHPVLSLTRCGSRERLPAPSRSSRASPRRNARFPRVRPFRCPFPTG